MPKIRTLLDILRSAGFGPITCVFVVVFMACSTAVWLSDPSTNSLGDGMWFSFEVVSTIGFGDVLATAPVARIATVILSAFSIFYIALVTGIVVSYCNAMVKQRQEGTLYNFMEKLERIDELPPEELAELAHKVREFRSKRR